ncbi:MAG: DUF2029 domain-containing protein [Planctomycetales bacterium]|nr:DUF2029 domain-containing protein [Planctomycetales bacterium]
MWWDPLNVSPNSRKWLWALLTVLVGIQQGPSFVASLRPRSDQGVDFFQEWSSAKSYLDTRPIYSRHAETIPRYLRLSVDAGQSESVEIEVDVNAHPPPSVFLALPFALLDYPNAVLAWNVLSLLLLAASLHWLVRELGIPFKAWSVMPMVTILLLSNPFRQQVNQGQFNLLLLFLLLAIWLAARSEKAWLAGTLLAVATAVKLFPGFLFLYFLLRRDWRIVAVGVTGVAVIGVAAGFALGWESYRTYVTEVLPQVNAYRGGWLNASLVGFCTRLFDPAAVSEQVEPIWRSSSFAKLLAGVMCLLVMVVVSRCVLRADTADKRDRAFGLTLVAMLLVSPITWDHYFLLLLLPLAQVWRDVSVSGRGRIPFLVIVIVLCLNPVLVWPHFIAGGRGHGVAQPMHSVTILAMQCYALVGLFVMGMRGAAVCREEPSYGTNSPRTG